MILGLGGQKLSLGGPPRTNDTSENPDIYEKWYSYNECLPRPYTEATGHCRLYGNYVTYGIQRCTTPLPLNKHDIINTLEPNYVHFPDSRT